MVKRSDGCNEILGELFVTCKKENMEYIDESHTHITSWENFSREATKKKTAFFFLANRT